MANKEELRNQIQRESVKVKEFASDAQGMVHWGMLTNSEDITTLCDEAVRAMKACSNIYEYLVRIRGEVIKEEREEENV